MAMFIRQATFINFGEKSKGYAYLKATFIRQTRVANIQMIGNNLILNDF